MAIALSESLEAKKVTITKGPRERLELQDGKLIGGDTFEMDFSDFFPGEPLVSFPEINYQPQGGVLLEVKSRLK